MHRGEGGWAPSPATSRAPDRGETTAHVCQVRSCARYAAGAAADLVRCSAPVCAGILCGCEWNRPEPAGVTAKTHHLELDMKMTGTDALLTLCAIVAVACGDETGGGAGGSGGTATQASTSASASSGGSGG